MLTSHACSPHISLELEPLHFIQSPSMATGSCQNGMGTFHCLENASYKNDRKPLPHGTASKAAAQRDGKLPA